jgi:hypothetical protein
MHTPDGRIYIVPVAGSSQFLHVVDRPDALSENIHLLQHHVSLRVRNGRSAPNIPNYRLDPMDGSPCDTLGINNLARSRWRYEPDVVYQPLRIRFTDLSFYEPTTWHWDFGDGQNSDEVHPIHTFPDYGLYYVCQSVSNAYATDSTCKWIEIKPFTSSNGPDARDDIYVAPNPFHDQLILHTRSGEFIPTTISVFDLHGKVWMPPTDLPVPISINLSTLPSGMYFCKVDREDGRNIVMKAVKE